MTKPVILVVQDYYLPGFRGGGSLRSVANIVAHLGGEFDFRLLSRDRDLLDEQPYVGIEAGWNTLERCQVRYLGPREVTPWRLAAIARSSQYDLLYFNSFFSTLTVFLLLARRFGMLLRRPVVLAPRGELATHALALKSRKKAWYLGLARRLNLFEGLIWHASSEQEGQEVRALFEGKIGIAMDPSTRGPAAPDPSKLPVKHPGAVRLVFLSRLARKKNVAKAIELVSQLNGEVEFDIYGIQEDVRYWAECEALIRGLPGHVRCAFRGAVPHERVASVLAQYHFFLFPTLNENFGHVILEALAVGLPVITSTETPWQNLASRGAGFALALDDDAHFAGVLQECVAMGSENHRQMSDRAIELAAEFLASSAPVDDTRRLLWESLGIAEPLGIAE